MGQINVGIDNLSPQHIDRSYGRTIAGVTTPFTSVTQANAAVNIVFRHKGKTVLIDDGSGSKEYWWKAGTADVNLVLKEAPGLNQPYKVTLITNGSYQIPVDFIVDLILVVPTVTFNLKIGFSAGAEDIMPEIPMIANQANVINVGIPAWGGPVTIHFTGPTATCIFLIYSRTMIPSNP